MLQRYLSHGPHKSLARFQAMSIWHLKVVRSGSPNLYLLDSQSHRAFLSIPPTSNSLRPRLHAPPTLHPQTMHLHSINHPLPELESFDHWSTSRSYDDVCQWLANLQRDRLDDLDASSRALAKNQKKRFRQLL